MKQHPICSLADAIQQKLPVALTTVVEVNSASPAKVGAQITLCEDGSKAGTVGGGELEADILADAQAVLADGEPRLTHYRLTEEGPDSLGCCVVRKPMPSSSHSFRRQN